MSIAPISRYDQWKLANPYETYGPWKHHEDCECEACEEAREEHDDE